MLQYLQLVQKESKRVTLNIYGANIKHKINAIHVYTMLLLTAETEESCHTEQCFYSKLMSLGYSGVQRYYKKVIH